MGLYGRNTTKNENKDISFCCLMCCMQLLLVHHLVLTILLRNVSFWFFLSPCSNFKPVSHWAAKACSCWQTWGLFLKNVILLYFLKFRRFWTCSKLKGDKKKCLRPLKRFANAFATLKELWWKTDRWAERKHSQTFATEMRPWKRLGMTAFSHISQPTVLIRRKLA